jgi:hypothetical protein
MVSGLQSRDYEDRLKELGLTTLEERRHQADMLLMYKLQKGDGQLGEAGWFAPPLPAAARMRRHADPLNVQPNQGRLELRRNAFSVRAGALWNAVPADIKRACTAENFKRQYAAHRNGMATRLMQSPGPDTTWMTATPDDLLAVQAGPWRSRQQV